MGVFVDEEVETIVRRTEECGLNRVQLHGRETATSIRQLRQRLPQGVEIIKAISILTLDDLALAEDYEPLVDYLLFDTKCETVGGSGRQFDWSILNHYQGQRPFLLSGGIRPEMATDLQSFHHPRWAGIDLNSGFESAPGVKKAETLRSFLIPNFIIEQK